MLCPRREQAVQAYPLLNRCTYLITAARPPRAAFFSTIRWIFLWEAGVSGISLCTPPITLNVGQAGDMFGPQVEGRALLEGEIMLLVDAEQTVTSSAAMTENGFDQTTGLL